VWKLDDPEVLRAEQAARVQAAAEAARSKLAGALERKAKELDKFSKLAELPPPQVALADKFKFDEATGGRAGGSAGCASRLGWPLPGDGSWLARQVEAGWAALAGRLAAGEPTHDKEGGALEGKALDKARKELEKAKKVGGGCAALCAASCDVKHVCWQARQAHTGWQAGRQAHTQLPGPPCCR
jgi:cysteinyl-tRNA synthetase